MLNTESPREMHGVEVEPEAALLTEMSPTGETCRLSLIDTTCKLTVPSDTLVEPVIPGHELMNFPTVAFLITHDSSNRQLLFDLGCRKDFWNLPRPISETIDAKVPGIRVDKNLVDVLTEGGVDVAKLEAAIVSHHHYDHIGDPATFPKSMDLLVGPGFAENFLPGYPTAQSSPLFEESLRGRNVLEIDFSGQLVVAGFKAHDYFEDGSLYILDSPGHAIGHLSALVRTTRDTFAFLGGDICHFAGAIRPTPLVPMPLLLGPDDIDTSFSNEPLPYPSSKFTQNHPNPSEARTSPYYKSCSRADSWYVQPALACQSIDHLKALDADPRFLVLIAHDPSIMKVMPFFPTADINDWHAAGWKRKLRWRFLDELPICGEHRPYLVGGTYMNGRLVKTLDGTKVLCGNPV